MAEKTITLKAEIRVRRDSTENWNKTPTYRPARGEIVIYEDYGNYQNSQGETVLVPGMKIGNGNAYLVDMPFVGECDRVMIMRELDSHRNNSEIHITQEERAFWNNKLNLDIEGTVLRFTRQ